MVAHVVGVVLDLLHEAKRLKVLHHELAGGEAIHPPILLGHRIAESSVGQEDVHELEFVALAYFVVVGIVARCDLHASRTELGIDVAILDDRNLTSDQR